MSEQRKIYQVYGKNAKEMTLSLLEASHAIQLVHGSVALKPNLVIAGTPESGSTTHPGVLAGCMEYFIEHGVKDISVIEGSWIGDDTMRAMKCAGYDEVCKHYHVPFFDLKRDGTRKVKTQIGEMEICRRALDAGLLVDLPVLKGHGQTLMTCALKNLKGCLPDREKRRFHAMGLQKPIAALGAALKPGLIVVDSICGDLNFEEGGTPVETNRMYLGTDAVQIDAYGLSLMGLMPHEVPYVELAEQYGGGKMDFSLSDIVELNHPSEAAAYVPVHGLVASLTRNVHADSACSACFASLVRAMYAGNVGKDMEISIGQGFKGKTITGIGIGECCRGAEVCVHGCPPTAEAVTQVLEEMKWKD